MRLPGGGGGTRRTDGVVWLVAGVTACSASLRLPLGDRGDGSGWLAALPGPGLFPLLLGVVLTALGALLLLGQPAAAGADRAPWADRRAGSLIVALLVYASVLESLGFLIATFLFLVVVLRTISMYRLPATLAMAGTASVAAWLVFVVGLGAQLPAGLLAR